MRTTWSPYFVTLEIDLGSFSKSWRLYVDLYVEFMWMFICVCCTQGILSFSHMLMTPIIFNLRPTLLLGSGHPLSFNSPSIPRTILISELLLPICLPLCLLKKAFIPSFNQRQDKGPNFKCDQYSRNHTFTQQFGMD